ncbi:hypothetical protein GH733_010471 [Mirounga leonina]|nr:hypothetical protein GH733_010471 [Mirounga leonina]
MATCRVTLSCECKDGFRVRTMAEDIKTKIRNYQTARFDSHFPNQNQTRNCWQTYLDFQHREKAAIVKGGGKGGPVHKRVSIATSRAFCILPGGETFTAPERPLVSLFYPYCLRPLFCHVSFIYRQDHGCSLVPGT